MAGGLKNIIIEISELPKEIKKTILKRIINEIFKVTSYNIKVKKRIRSRSSL